MGKEAVDKRMKNIPRTKNFGGKYFWTVPHYGLIFRQKNQKIRSPEIFK